MISLQCKAKRRTTSCISHNYCTITFVDIEHYFLSAKMSDNLYLLTTRENPEEEVDVWWIDIRKIGGY